MNAVPPNAPAAPAAPVGRSRTRRWLRRLAWTAGSIVVLMGLAWLVLPIVLKSQGEQQLTKLLGRQVTIGQVKFLPWSLELTVTDLTIAGLPGEEPLLKLARFYANTQMSSLWKLAPVIEAAEFDTPTLHLARLAEGHYDIDDLIARFTPQPDSKPSTGAARFSLNNLQVRNGALSFDDKPIGRRHELRQLQVSLPFISNLPADVELKVQPRLAFELNGAAFDSGAQATPFAKDRASAVQVHIGEGAKEDLDLVPYLGYLPKTLPVRLLRGKVGGDLELAFSLLSDGTPSLGVKGQLQASDFALSDAGGTPLLEFGKLTVPLSDVQPLRGQVHLGAVQLDGAKLDVSRDAAGQLSVMRLAVAAAPPAASAAPASQPASAPAAAAAKPAWKIEVDSLALNGARVVWSDAAVHPAAALQLDGLALSAKGLRWPDPAPVPLTLSATLRPQGDAAATAGRFSVEGTANDSQARLQIGVEQFTLPVLAPYLAVYLVPRVEGQLDLKAGVDWAAGESPHLKFALSQADLAGLRLVSAAGPGAKAATEAFALKQLSLRDVDVDWSGQTASVGSLSLQGPQLKVARDAQGRWNLLQWAVAAPAASSAAPAAPAAASGPAWRARVADFKLDGGRIGFVDELPKPNPRPSEVVKVELSGLTLSAQGLAWDGRRDAAPVVPPAKLQLAANLVRSADAAERNRGAVSRIEWRGQAGLQPLLAKGTARIERFPVHAFEPYMGNPLRVSLLRSLASYRGDMALKDTGRGFAASANGEVLINDMSLLSRPESPEAVPEELLSWQSLALRGVKFAIEPAGRPRLDITHIDLSDFYSRLVITDQGRFNLQEVAPPAAPATRVADAASAPQPAASPASAAALPPQGYALPLDLTIGGIKLDNGKVDFSDHFIKPNYSAALTQLSGSLGAFSSSSREMATLDLRGRAEGTALLEIAGKLNPTAQPLELDIHAKATDLELAPLSPYAGKYAGYDIERGKLSMDVSYQIQPDGRLTATNKVVLNQLTFGDKVESPSATKLPVLLAVALLKDRNGVIDLDLPISGSINDPQFSVIGLIFKVIGNLLVKAVTSPFSLFGGGASDDLSTIVFKPGTTEFAASDTAAIDKVAKALTDRPALRMTVTGASDLASEREAYQRAALEQRLLSERKRELIRDGAAADAPVTMNAEDHQRLLEEVYSKTKLENKPRNVLGIAKSIPPEQMEAMLSAAIPVNGDTMRELALQRGLAVRDQLIAKGLPSERLFIAAPKVRAAGDDAKDWKPSVQLTLSTK